VAGFKQHSYVLLCQMDTICGFGLILAWFAHCVPSGVTPIASWHEIRGWLLIKRTEQRITTTTTNYYYYYYYYYCYYYYCCFSLAAVHIVTPHKLTPWSRVLLRKLIVTQLVKKYPAFYVTRRFKSPPLIPTLSHIHPIHTFPPYFPKIHSNITVR
jgi:hypothetical protein